ncbi:unnamed protein product [Owenia fusiformis]|uniref:Bicarbonate transporter-like transmembrane domain-containing protein n=1 Tax=Owenia fusiformis TaxID=6347 RepID=A0A8S4PUF5_OWEFU|nr:unnamed protein product [Owenia fusiformis]
MAAGICGVSFAIFAGQPLIILGCTGPMLAFETILYNFAIDNGFTYMSFRVWVGIWTSAVLIIIVAFDLSAMVKYITRFTQEGYSCLISLSIVEASKKAIGVQKKYKVNLRPNDELDYNCSCLAPDVDVNPGTDRPMYNTTDMAADVKLKDTYKTNPLGLPGGNASIDFSSLPTKYCKTYGGVLFGSGCDTPHYVADVFLMSFLLFLGVFIIAMSLGSFRTTQFFPNIVRKTLADFAMPIAIGIMTAVDIVVGLETPKMHIPETFAPTRPDRGWIINPMGENPWWCILVAIPPALLLAILIFMDQQITAVIINKKDHLLKKGAGYHLDLLIIAVQVVVCSFLGIPYIVAATARAINHVLSLTRESETSAPGEKPKFLGVREQRVTGTLAFLFIGLSVFFRPVLKYVPIPVLHGVFLYMGIGSLKNVQLVQRLLLLFTPSKYQPDYAYLRHVDTKRVHLLTIIQVICIALLWVVRSVKKISIIFPLMLLVLCLVRKFMERIFTAKELRYIDDPLPPVRLKCWSRKENNSQVGNQKKELMEIVTNGNDTKMKRWNDNSST